MEKGKPTKVTVPTSSASVFVRHCCCLAGVGIRDADGLPAVVGREGSSGNGGV